MIVDGATLLSFFDRDDPGHWAAMGQIELAAESESLVVSPFVISELETVVRERCGLEGWLAALEQLAGGAWTLAHVDPTHLAALRDRIASGSSLGTASADVLAEHEE